MRRERRVWYNNIMNLWATVKGLFRNAGGIRDNADVEREGNGGGFIRSRPVESMPYLISAASECLLKRRRLNQAELQIAARAIRYAS